VLGIVVSLLGKRYGDVAHESNSLFSPHHRHRIRLQYRTCLCHATHLTRNHCRLSRTATTPHLRSVYHVSRPQPHPLTIMHGLHACMHPDIVDICGKRQRHLSRFRSRTSHGRALGAAIIRPGKKRSDQQFTPKYPMRLRSLGRIMRLTNAPIPHIPVH
jgi:hypothetical protein